MAEHDENCAARARCIAVWNSVVNKLRAMCSLQHASDSLHTVQLTPIEAAQIITCLATSYAVCEGEVHLSARASAD